MNQLKINTRNKQVLFLFTLLIMTAIIATAGVASAHSGDHEFEGLEDILEHIAEDMEEIHHDMHKVAFSLKVISYSSVGIFVVLLGHLFVMLKKK
jgi:hypothetical protein